MARPKKAVAVKTPRKQRSDADVKRKAKAPAVPTETVFVPKAYSQSIVFDKMKAAQEQNEAMVGRPVDVPLEEQVNNLRRERNVLRDRASNAEGALRRELNYHQLRIEEINVLIENLNDLRYA